MREIKTYEALYDASDTKGVYGISLVYDPAMVGHFLKFSNHKEKVQFSTINEEKRILLGLVLEPNKLVYRNQGGEEFNIVFSEDTIKELSHNFLKQGYQSNSSLEHSEEIHGVTFVESWTVENPKIDKSVNFGMSYPKGSWLVMMKVDNDEVWNDYIKNGKVRGFSIDALVKLKEVNKVEMSKEQENKKLLKSIEDIFLSVFGKKEDVKLGEIKSKDGKVKYMFDGEELKTEISMWAVGDDDQRVDLPARDYEVEGGKVVTLSTDGVVTEIKEAGEENTAEAEPEEEKEEVALSQKEVDDFLKAMEQRLIGFTEQNKPIEVNLSKATEILELKKEIEELKGKVLKFEDKPAAMKLNSQPVNTTSNTSKGRITEFLNNNK